MTEEKKELVSDKDKNRDRCANTRGSERGETRAHSLSKIGEWVKRNSVCCCISQRQQPLMLMTARIPTTSPIVKVAILVVILKVVVDGDSVLVQVRVLALEEILLVATI